MGHSLQSPAAPAVYAATPQLQVSLRRQRPLLWMNHRRDLGKVSWTERKTVTKEPRHSPQDDACLVGRLSATAPAARRDEVSRAEPLEGKHREQLRILMVAGGTGGHVYPAIAIADEIRNLCGGGDDDDEHGATVQFVGTADRMEWGAVPKAGYEITAIPAVALRRPLLSSMENLLLPAKLLMALLFSWKLLRRLKPHVVVGTGGYVSGPVCLLAAVAFGCPVVIQEQNAYAGVANRLLGRVAAAIFVAFSAAIPYFPKEKCILQGNPTRKALRQSTSFSTPDARKIFFSAPQNAAAERAPDGGGMPELAIIQNWRKQADELEQVVLILGGSLGARAVNLAVAGMAVAMLEKHPTKGIIWQTGGRYYREVLDRVGMQHPRLVIVPYVDAMHVAYAAVDLVVARAGAITCSELLVAGKPAILIPSTNVAEDHQAKNAAAMAKHGSARVMLESSLNSQALSEVLCELLGDPERLTVMADKALAAATPDAATRIAEHVVRLARCYRSGLISGSGLREGLGAS